MLCLRELFSLAKADYKTIGNKALILKELNDLGLPVPPTWVIGSETWLQILSALKADKILEHRNWETFQQVARSFRQQIIDHPLTADWSVIETPPPLLLRSSLTILGSGGKSKRSLQLSGLLPGQICITPEAYTSQLKKIWIQALGANSLKVWRHHCQSLEQVRLSIIAQPLLPAVLSGTLFLTGSRAIVEVVSGLGFPLTSGEAQPASCRVDGNQYHWQAGHQERGCYVSESPPHTTWKWHSEPFLTKPLERNQLEQLNSLGKQVQRHLGPNIRIEWIAIESPAGGSLEFILTQAAIWFMPDLAVPDKISDAPSPPEIPSIQAAIRGIAAASGRGLAPALVVKNSAEMPTVLPSGCIIVARDIQPDLFGKTTDLLGIVTEGGGATCHAAILARELGIPAVVGAPEAVNLIETGDYLWLDGDKGVIYIVPDTHQSPWLQRPSSPPPETSLKTQTQVMVNLSQSSHLSDFATAIDGVGLIRSEWLLLDGLGGRHPQQWIDGGHMDELEGILVHKLQAILSVCGNKPVRYRSLDLRSHEWTYLHGSPHREVNPMLGLRGTFSYQQDFRLFQTELSALRTLQRSGYSNLELILPFVRTVEEVNACQHQITQAGLSEENPFRLWIMAEVPSVLFLLSNYARAGIHGIAIGTNDLTQLLLAVDREQPILANTYDERHPAVLAALHHLVKQAQIENIACSLCGQAPVRFPEIIDLLVAWGIDSICIEPGAIDRTRRAIFQAEQSLKI